ncbi:putative Phosphate carrier protein [Naja naja]|nr:putative Phosphate carrier protein [Naja naja]
MFSTIAPLVRLNPFHAPQLELHQNSCGPRKRLVESEEVSCTRRSLAAASAEEEYSCEYGSLKFYAICGFGGILSCGLTHTALVPLDLVKCRIQQLNTLRNLFYYVIQTHSAENVILLILKSEKPESKRKVKWNKSVEGGMSGFSVTLKEDGVRGLGKGWAPTFIGYSMQGLCKFGFYEVFKILYGNMLGEENSYLWRTSLYLAASASAEFFADIALSPMEAAKVRIQTQPGYANTLRQAAPKMFAEEGVWAFYKGVAPLWMRQIPYTMMKFACFERTVEALYRYVVPKPRSECSKAEQLVVTFVAGYIGVWKGLFARIIMIGTLTALQWFIYDSVKVYFKLPRPPPPEMPDSLKKKLGLTE